MNLPDALPIPREDAAWLAGILDGEGCFDAPRNNPRIRVKMSDLDVVLRVATVMGAKTYMERPRFVEYKPCMVAQITGDNAISVLRAVLPWLGSRRTAKATELILAHSARQAVKGARHLKAA